MALTLHFGAPCAVQNLLRRFQVFKALPHDLLIKELPQYFSRYPTIKFRFVMHYFLSKHFTRHSAPN